MLVFFSSSRERSGSGESNQFQLCLLRARSLRVVPRGRPRNRQPRIGVDNVVSARHVLFPFLAVVLFCVFVSAKSADRSHGVAVRSSASD